MSVPRLSIDDVPALAKGAVIPPNKEFLAVLGDQKSGTNIEAPTSEIEAVGCSDMVAAAPIQLSWKSTSRCLVAYLIKQLRAKFSVSA